MCSTAVDHLMIIPGCLDLWYVPKVSPAASHSQRRLPSSTCKQENGMKNILFMWRKLLGLLLKMLRLENGFQKWNVVSVQQGRSVTYY